MEGFDNKDYVVDRALRKGPHGNVYKARRVLDGVLCTIKEFDVSHMTEEEKETSMKKVQLLATVHNENVINYFDACAKKTKLYVVMEYCDELDLGEHIKTRAEQKRFFNEGQIWSYLIQMLRGLVALHSKGIIHRNVKSGNIIQFDNNVVKLGDLGVGKLTNEGSAASQIGNPHYIPPEVWENKSYTFKSDVWALGCVLYELTALAVPFGGCSLPDLRLKVIEGFYQPIPSSFSSGLGNVLKLLLNPDEGSRISSTDMLLHPILQAHLQHAPLPLPVLRVRTSEENIRLGPIPAQRVSSSMSKQLKGSYPTLAVAADKQLVQRQALHSRQTVATTSTNGHQSGLSCGKHQATSVRSKVVPILTPRAILSSPDNDQMLSELNRPSNQSAKVKVPRVANLGRKVTPKVSSGTSVTPLPQGQPSTPRVNLKHFKTAYIQSPKIASDEFPAANVPVNHDRSRDLDKEKVENRMDTPSRIKSANSGIPRKEKSVDSGRSVASGSDDSIIHLRASIHHADPVHIKFGTLPNESSAGSVASSRSDDSVVGVRAPLDVWEATHVKVGTPRRSAGTSPSNDSAISARMTIDELDPAQRPFQQVELLEIASVNHPVDSPIIQGYPVASVKVESNNCGDTLRLADTRPLGKAKAETPRGASSYSLKSLADGRLIAKHARDFVPQVTDGSELASKPHDRPGDKHLSSRSLRSEKLKTLSGTKQVSGVKPVNTLDHIKVSILSGNSSLKSVTAAGVPTDSGEDPLTQGRVAREGSCSAQRQNSTRNVCHSFDIVGKDKPLKTPVLSKTMPVSGHSTGAASRTYSGGSLHTSAELDRVVTEHTEEPIHRGQTADQSSYSAQRLPKHANRRLSLDTARKELLAETYQGTSRVLKTKPVTSHTKVALGRSERSADMMKPKVSNGVAQKDLNDCTCLRGAADGMDLTAKGHSSTTRMPISHKKAFSPRRAISENPLKVVPKVPLLRKPSSDRLTVVPSKGVVTSQQYDSIVEPLDTNPTQRQHQPVCSRRLSLDFPIKV